MKRLWIVVLPVLLLTGCTDASFFAVNFPSHFDDVRIEHDIAYGSRPDEKLDIYHPPHGGGQPFPVIVFYYGGNWKTGSKEDYRFVGDAFSKRGYVVVIADYRKYPQVKFPAFVKDGAKALAWVADHIDSYGGDVKHIYVAGHSAGAHIAALIVSDPRYLAAYGKNRRVVKAFAGLAGPYDFVPDTDDLKAIFAPPNRYSQMQVSTFIDGKQPPTLLLWGADDKVVGKPNLDKLAAAIHKKGGCVKTKIYPDVDHVWLVGELSWAGDDKANVLQDMEEYFEQPQCS